MPTRAVTCSAYSARSPEVEASYRTRSHRTSERTPSRSRMPATTSSKTWTPVIGWLGEAATASTWRAVEATRSFVCAAGRSAERRDHPLVADLREVRVPLPDGVEMRRRGKDDHAVGLRFQPPDRFGGRDWSREDH